jgi:two-component system sensor histidine kinase GlrK
MIGYVVVLALATGVSVYAIIQLGQMRDVTHSIILVDNPFLDLHNKLSDALLSETRYDKKYTILHDKALHDNFLTARAEFEAHLDEAARIADTDEMRGVILRVLGFHRFYQALFTEEAGYIQTGKKYNAAWFNAEKEKAVDALMGELMQVRVLSQNSIFGKVHQLNKAGVRAINAATVTTATALIFGVVLSLIITASITKPLAVMKRKTAEISSGIYEADLALASPPEIAALGESFNLMCVKLKAVDKMKSDFYALMSHELRTPLTSIKEGTNLFLEGQVGEVTEKQKKILSIIAEESNRLIELVNSLLDIAKLEAGMVAYSFSTVDLNALVMRAVKEVTPLADAKRIAVDKDLHVLPLVQLDAERFLQALRNLIGNALKFTPRGGTVTIASRPVENGVAISVADTGPGIPPEHAAIIFDKYRQAAVAGAQKLQGTGLGLAIVKHIVQDHGGRVWVESEIGRGSIFTMVLPASSRLPEAAAAHS